MAGSIDIEKGESMALIRRILRREPTPEFKCPKCQTPAPPDAVDCAVCGWDLRESYHGREPEVAEHTIR
jgi:hypothetical protein